jgi:secreted trypsin-like serine protease
MTANKVMKGPLWATLVGVLVAAMVVSFFVFVQSGEAAPQATADNQPTKITDGKAVPNGKYPFMVALLDKRNPGSSAFHDQYCGGTLIEKDRVLTAAHCFFDPNTGDPAFVSLKVLKVIVGRTVLTTTSQGQVRSVNRVFIHPKYNPKAQGSGFSNYDAAVLALSRPVSGIAPIKLASSKQNYLEKPGRKATVAGWGRTTEVPACKPSNSQPFFADRMLEAQVPIVSDSSADQLYENICRFSGLRSTYTPPLMVAAGGTGTDTCQGDSGGPLFVAQASSANYVQIGITSFGPGCGPERYPTAYTELNARPIASFISSQRQ